MESTSSVSILEGADFTGKLETGLTVVAKPPYQKNTVVYMGEDNKERNKKISIKRNVDNYLNSSSGRTGVRPLIW